MTEADRRRAPFAAAAVAAGVLAAILLPGAPLGAGVVAVAAALLVAAGLSRTARAGRPAAVLGAGAVLLSATAVLRDAGWVTALELAAALGLGSIAMSWPQSWRATAMAAVAVLWRLPAGAVLVADMSVRAVPDGGHGQARAIGRGLALAVGLVGVFLALFATGDRAFAQLAGQVIPEHWEPGDVWLRLIVFGLVVGLAGALAHAASVRDEPCRKPLLAIGAIEWRLALVALNLLFAVFVAVQVAVLFGGDAYVRETAGLTYAQYAREGFAQLLVVGVLTLAVVAAALRWSGAEAERQQRALLAVLCVLTLVVLASALHRLGLYEEAYGFTRTRLAAHAFLLFDGALFVLVLAALARQQRAWLPRATVALSAVAAIAFSLSDPDRRIAERNVERYEATGRIDTNYLSHLSADAVGVLARLPRPLRDAALRTQRERLARRHDGFAGANVARARARGVLERLP